MNRPGLSIYANEEEVVLSDGIRCKIIDIQRMVEQKSLFNDPWPGAMEENSSGAKHRVQDQQENSPVQSERDSQVMELTIV